VSSKRKEKMSNKSRKLVRESRKLGIPLSPKAERLFKKRPYPPGEHGKSRKRQESDYLIRLKEKQRLRAQYGLKEKQLIKTYNEAKNEPGLVCESLVELLEMRLDSLVLRSGFARTIYQARQMVSHRHILVDGQIVDKPSFRVKIGQTIQAKPSSAPKTHMEVASLGCHRDVLPNVPEYLDCNIEKLKSILVKRPKRIQVPITCDVQLVVEYYSR
jgi:small subunit ribosomal protein S4